jgi:putative DNA primase/helicase
LSQRYGFEWCETLGVKTSRGAHLYFTWPEGAVIRNSAGKIAAGLDIRGDGGYVIVPPSVHPTGEPYRWLGEGEHVPICPAPSWLLATIIDPPRTVDSVPASSGEVIPKGSRNQTLASLAGTMRKRAMSREAIAAALQTLNKSLCDPPLEQTEVSSIAASVARYTPGPECSLANEEEWSEPEPLGAELLPVEPFSLRFLPTSLRPMIEDVSERMQTPIDFAAAAAVVALAGCVNRRAAVKPKRLDDWTVISNLWGLIVGKPGFMKSPVLRAVIWPLLSTESLWQMERKEALAEFAKEKEIAELRHAAWKELFKQASKKGGIPPVAPDDSLVQPTEKRLVLTDVTFEKVHEIMVENPAGVLIVRDELAGWLADLEKPGRESERQFFLQAWNGDGHFNVDRIGRGTIRVPAVCVSLIGNIQPGRLRNHLQATLTGGCNDDGLIQRFQIAVWPDADPTWRLVDRKPNRAAVSTVERVFTKLLGLSADDPIRVSFNPEAQEVFFSWLAKLEEKVRQGYGLHPALVAHLSKYRSLLPTLAALFELADRAAANDMDNDVLISAEHTEQGLALCNYLESHAKRMYGCVESPDMAAARELARHLKLGELPETFTTRDVYRRGWSGLTQPDHARNALELLADSSWVRQLEIVPTLAGGRPTAPWKSNPRIRRHGE